MGAASDERNVMVHFRMLSGEGKEVSMMREATANELCEVAFALFKVSMRLTLGSEILRADLSQPLLAAPCGQSVEVTVMRVVRGEADGVPQGFIGMVRERRWLAATCFLRAQWDPRRTLKEADSSGDTALSWVAYKAGWSLAALELIRVILNIAPGETRVRSPSSGFLPLHEAAWGNASPSVAVLLAAANPSAVHARSRSGETPHCIGAYHHQKAFLWPPPEELLEQATALRQEWRQVKTLGALRRSPYIVTRQRTLEEVVSTGLALPRIAALAVAGFLSALPAPDDPLSLAPPRGFPRGGIVERVAVSRQEVIGDPEEQVDRLLPRYVWADTATPNVSGAPRRRARRDFYIYKPRQRPTRGRNLRAPLPARPVDEVEHIRECFAKERGRLAGARDVRNKRCGFSELAEVSVGGSGAVFRLRSHAVTTVSKDVQRPPPEEKWPSKAPLRRERRLDRAMKIAESLLMEECFADMAN